MSAIARYGKYAVKKYPAIRKRYKVYTPAVKQLASDVMYLKGLINSEPKFHIVQSSNNVDYNGTTVSLCDVPSGDTSVNRDGDRILPRYMSINLTMGRATGATSAHLSVRMIILRAWVDNPAAGGAGLSVGEVLSTVGSQFSPHSHLNSTVTGPRGDRNRRLEILRNEAVTFNAVNNHSASYSYNIEMNGKGTRNKEHIEFYSSTTGQPPSGGVYILFITDNATSGEFYYIMESKLTFYDN